jgi:hypothetical protein
VCSSSGKSDHVIGTTPVGETGRRISIESRTPSSVMSAAWGLRLAAPVHKTSGWSDVAIYGRSNSTSVQCIEAKTAAPVTAVESIIRGGGCRS